MKKLLAVAAILLFVIVLAACLAPEKFVAKIELDKDGNVSYQYHGTMVNLDWKNYTPNQKEVAKAKNEMMEDTNVINVEYLGKGRFMVDYIKRGNLELEPVFNTNLVKVSLRLTDRGRVAVIEREPLKEKELKELKSKNATIDGVLEVKTSGKVLVHNTSESPRMWGLFGDYKWKFTSFTDPTPFMVVQLD